MSFVSPFIAKVPRDEYIKQVNKHFMGKSPSREALIAHMTREGIILNHYAIASYFILKWNESLKIIDCLVKEGKLIKFLDSGTYGVDYFLRIDIWENYDYFMKNSGRKEEHPLVDILDILTYYGISTTTFKTKFLPQIRDKAIKFPTCKQLFFKAQDISELQKTPDFRNSLSTSFMEFSAQYVVKPGKERTSKREMTKRAYIKEPGDSFTFRDTSCKNYDNCYEFAVKHTNYINCNKCHIYQYKNKEIVLEILTPGIVFVPPKKEGKYAHIINNQSLPNIN